MEASENYPSLSSLPSLASASQWPIPDRNQGPWEPSDALGTEQDRARLGEARDPSKTNRQGRSHLRGSESLPVKSELVSITCVNCESLQKRMGRTNPLPGELRTKVRALQPKSALAKSPPISQRT